MPVAAHRPDPLPALTGLRFVAALQVVLFHTAAPLVREGPRWLRQLVAGGYTAVGLFFVLSGFILAYVYHGRELSRRDVRRRFWLARVARIYPAYLLGLLLAAPYFVQVSWLRSAHPLAESLGIGAAALSLTQAWIPAAACRWNCPGWSLSVEAFFYAIFPVALLVVARRPRRRLVAWAILLWLAALVLPTVYLLLQPDGVGPGDPNSRAPWLAAVKFSPLAHLPLFLLGMLAGRWFAEGGGAAGAGHSARRAAAWAAPLAAGAMAGVLVLGGRVPYLLLHDGLLAPLAVVLVLALAIGHGPLARLLASPPLQALGEASYALYILHLPIFLFCLHRLPFIELGLPYAPAGAAVYLLFTLCISVLVHRRIEEPARRWITGARSAPHGGREAGRIATAAPLAPTS